MHGTVTQPGLRTGGDPRSRYRRGDWVRVRSPSHIASTLNENGCLAGLPFMREMARFAGRTLQVRSSAHKTCDENEGSGLRRMGAAVFLHDAHCDGSSHGGCQSRCPFFWKDEWLEPAPPNGSDGDQPSGQGETFVPGREDLERKAARTTRLRGRDPDRGTFSCQSTELFLATAPLPIWSPHQYWDDLRSSNITLGALLRRLPLAIFNRYQNASRRILPRRLWIRGARTYPDTVGTLQATPELNSGIQAGETVEIRSHEEILATLDRRGTNRGLSMSADMLPYCGQTAVVRHRVELRIDERTGELRRMRNPCLVLDGVTCGGWYNGFCSREADLYWREIWLRRKEER
ncbi:MAG: hypothetical protein ACLP01_25900 [Solirubrobacteraceae bacterium]